MVKAFIGANYLYVAYAFKQSGLLLGIVGMLVIAALTDHCCHLIVQTKNHAINHLIKKHKAETANSRSENRKTKYNDCDADCEEENDTSASSSPNFDNAAIQNEEIEEEYHSPGGENIHEKISQNMSYGDIGFYCYGNVGLGIVNFFIAMTQFGFCTSYSIFIGNTIHSLFPYNKCVTDNVTNITHCEKVYIQENGTDPSFGNVEFYSIAPDLRILVISPILVFILFALIRNVRYLGVVSVLANLSILFGVVSIFAYLIYNFSKHGKKETELYNLQHFSLFFGMVAGAFEGIGLVIPIESSMVGNRHLFTWFLHGAVGVLTIILGVFGILGYLTFGQDVQQMLNKNLPPGEFLGIFVNVGICVGIMLTYPLQIFPVIEIIERYLFLEGRIFGPPKKNQSDKDETKALIASDREPLEEDNKHELTEHMPSHIPDSVATWKRNMVRVIIVMASCGLAILLKDYFAYVGGFNGAVGSTALAFILPCLFHLKVCWHDLHPVFKAKDILIIIFGVCAGCVSVVAVIQRIASGETEE
ncbi:AVT3-like protein [Mya arenaria]|uniref:AVT3-like protein n=2 Tax=Mya arenaria TaxID=6604 RepID=A0ABY7DHE9_MYAAR|nr:AVT3-like protein [Mya arenaria]